MIVAITGGTGFIGRQVAEQHLQTGDTVRVLVRNESSAVGLAGRAKVISSDLATGRESLVEFVDGADVLYHCAGEFRKPERMRALNVDGTARLIAAATGKIGRWVQLSSVAAYGRPGAGAVVDEATVPQPHDEYARTKLEADELVAAAAKRGAFSHVIIRPAMVFGPGMSSRALSQMISLIQRQWFFFIGRPGAFVNGVFIDNLVGAMATCAKQQEAVGQTFNLSDFRTLEAFVDTIAHALGCRVPSIRLPEAPIRWAARTIGRLPGVPLTESRVAALCNRVRYSSVFIERTLGYSHAVSMEEGLQRLVADWRQRN